MSASLRILENSILFRLVFLILASFRNSFFHNLFSEKITFSNSLFFSYIVILLEKIIIKLSFLKVYFDQIINFCLNKPAKKIIIVLMFFILTNEFFRNNLLADFFYTPLLIIIFLIIAVNSINIFEKEKTQLLLYIFLIFFIIKIFYFFGAYNFTEFSDERTGYSEFGWRVLKYWFYNGQIYSYFNNGRPVIEGWYVVNTKSFIYSFIALIYYFFGKHFLIAKLFTLFIHLISGILIYFLAKHLFDQKTAVISIILFYVSFSINIFSIALLQEGPMTFLVLLFFLLLVKCDGFLSRHHHFKAVMTFFFMYFIYYIMVNIREYVAKLLVPSFFAWAFFYVIKKSKTYGSFRNFAFFIIFALVFSLIFIDWNSTLINIKERTNYFFKYYLNAYRNSDAENGRLAFFTGADVSTPVNALKFSPIGLTYVFFSVLPSEVSSLDLWVFFIFDTVLWYFLLLFIILGSVYALKDKTLETIPMLVFIILMIAGHALVEGNFGNLLRHSAQYKSLMLIFGAYGINKLLL